MSERVEFVFRKQICVELFAALLKLEAVEQVGGFRCVSAARSDQKALSY